MSAWKQAINSGVLEWTPINTMDPQTILGGGVFPMVKIGADFVFISGGPWTVCQPHGYNLMLKEC